MFFPVKAGVRRAVLCLLGGLLLCGAAAAGPAALPGGTPADACAPETSACARVEANGPAAESASSAAVCCVCTDGAQPLLVHRGGVTCVFAAGAPGRCTVLQKNGAACIVRQGGRHAEKRAAARSASPAAGRP